MKNNIVEKYVWILRNYQKSILSVWPEYQISLMCVWLEQC